LRPAPIRFPSSKRSLDPDGPFVCRGRKPSSPVSSRKQPLGLSPEGFSGQIGPPEGRAPHARNVDITPTEMLSLFGHQPFARPSVIMRRPGLRPALPRGRTECVPPRKSPIARSPGLSPEGHLASNRPPGRGGLRTPVKAAWAEPRRVPAKGSAVPYFSVIMPYPGLRPALPRGRAERVPPRKSPIARSPGLPPQGHLASDRPPRGGAGSARPRRAHGPDRGVSPLRARPALTSR